MPLDLHQPFINHGQWKLMFWHKDRFSTESTYVGGVRIQSSIARIRALPKSLVAKEQNKTSKTNRKLL